MTETTTEGQAQTTELKPPAGFGVPNKQHYRKGTAVCSPPTHFLLGNAGMGDLVCYLRAMQWVADTQPQLQDVTIWTFTFFFDVVVAALANHPGNWKLRNIREFNSTEVLTQGVQVFAGYSPTYGADGSHIFGAARHYFNAAGSHALDLGFLYYANTMYPPEGYNNYPKLTGLPDVSGLIPGVRPIAVITGGATTALRALPANIFNELKDMFLKSGFIPVFLGKSKIDVGYEVRYSKEYNYEGGINLIDKTTLIQSAAVMERADIVVGLDNGLLHLAGCFDTPLVIGYNVAHPNHRLPRRDSGRIATVIPDVACRFCQSNMRHMGMNLQDRCIYNDVACAKELTIDKWKKAVEEVGVTVL